MKKLYLVVEGEIIWAAFPDRKMAVKFKRREFGDALPDGCVPVNIVRLPVYQTLEEAPTTSGNTLKAAAIL